MLFPIIAVISWGVVIKATVALTLASLISIALHKQSAALRHFVWCLALAGSIGIFAVSEFAPTWDVAILPNDNASNASEVSTPFSNTPILDSPIARVDGDLPTVDQPAGITSNDESKNALLSTSKLASVEPDRRIGSIQNYVMAVWIFGLAVCITPVLVGLIRIEFLSRKCVTIHDDSVLMLLDDCCQKLKVKRAIKLLELDDERPPMTSGVFQVNIFLPKSWRSWSDEQLNCVLMHELAHIKRLDVAWYLLGRTACSLYWFHPLAWYGLYRLKIEREIASDDRVIATGHRATDYASELLNVARTCLFPTPIVGAIAMAQSTKLENRIRQLLDPTLGHNSVSTTSHIAMLAISTLLVAAVGMFQPVAKSFSPAHQDDAVITSVDSDSIRLQGVVLAPDGTPVPQADVHLGVTEASTFENVSTTMKTGADGRFSFEINALDFKTTDGEIPEFRGGARAFAEGFGFGVAKTFDSRTEAADIVIKLAKPGNPIKGQIVDLEGNNVAGATVKIIGIATPKDGKLSTFIDAIPEAYEARALERKHLSISSAPSQLSPTQTDIQGRFEFKDIGEERMLMCRIDGPTIESRIINILPVEMDTKSLPDYARSNLGTTIYYGNNFRHAAANALPVSGTVTDIESGKPIAGVKLKTRRSLGGSGFIQSLETTSDEAGKFSINGIPAGQAVSLLATIDDQPYFESLVVVEKDTRSVEVKLKRGTWITGRVTNDDGEPVEAAVFYYVSADNLNRKSAPGFAGGQERGWIVPYYKTKKDGTFRRVGFPGVGILAVRVTGRIGDAYTMGVGAENITWGEPFGSGTAFSTYPSIVVASNFNRLIEINPKAGEKSFEKNIELNRGNIVTGKVVDEKGNPLTGYHISGNTAVGVWSYKPAEESRFKVYAFDPKSPRRITLIHNEKKLAGSIVVEGDPPDKLEVEMKPWSTIKGRLLDSSGEPMAGTIIFSLPDLRRARMSPRLPRGKFRTDAEGRFRIEGLAADAGYIISAMTDETILKRELIANVKLNPGEVKDLGDLKVEP